jgi:hypothetical protein
MYIKNKIPQRIFASRAVREEKILQIGKITST